MVFLFLLDVTCSILCKCAFKVGTWVAYKSYDGVYYLYNINKKHLINIFFIYFKLFFNIF